MNWYRFSDLAIDDDEISMLRRVHIHVCSLKDMEPESEGGAEIGKMLFHLYRQGVRSEVGLMRMVTADEPPPALEAE
ncbi:hypothetical protein EKH55_1504 [Sinorhizobium alkalisoli]|nr:hypothetical protein EKH55_1504 [Sinorhizobium alkalisoli]